MAAYALAKAFLPKSGVEGVTPDLVEKYLHLDKTTQPQTLPNLYERVLGSAQNANMKVGVIGGSIGGVDKLGAVLCGFEPARVLEKYAFGWEGVLDDIVAHLKPRGCVRRTSRSIWPGYCRTILSSAKFLSQFFVSRRLLRWVDYSTQTRSEPGRLTSCLSPGDRLRFGSLAWPATSAMGLGVRTLLKPDVHVKVRSYGRIGLCPKGLATTMYSRRCQVAQKCRCHTGGGGG
jgi:hypothetical protein